MNIENKIFSGDLLKKELLEHNSDFANLINTYKAQHLIFDFGDEEWARIKSQNFPDLPGGFIEVFEKGINMGNCGATAKRLSYSYDDVDLIMGTLPILKGTISSPEGGHAWLEDNKYIYDTTLLLKIDKSIKDKLGYEDEVVLTSWQLLEDPFYQARKKFVNDPEIRKSNANQK